MNCPFLVYVRACLVQYGLLSGDMVEGQAADAHLHQQQQLDESGQKPFWSAWNVLKMQFDFLTWAAFFRQGRWVRAT